MTSECGRVKNVAHEALNGRATNVLNHRLTSSVICYRTDVRKQKEAIEVTYVIHTSVLQ